MSQDFFKDKTKLVGISVLILDLAVLVFGAWFLTLKIAGANATLRAKKTEIETIYQNWQMLAKSQKELRKAEVDLKKINNAFVSLETPYDFISRLDELARSMAASYEVNLVAMGGQNQDQEKAVRFQITFFGSFNNLMHFLKLLENMQYYARVESLQINQVRGGSAQTKNGPQILPPGSVHSLITLKAFTK